MRWAGADKRRAHEHPSSGEMCAVEKGGGRRGGGGGRRGKTKARTGSAVQESQDTDTPEGGHAAAPEAATATTTAKEKKDKRCSPHSGNIDTCTYAHTHAKGEGDGKVKLKTMNQERRLHVSVTHGVQDAEWGRATRAAGAHAWGFSRRSILVTEPKNPTRNQRHTSFFGCPFSVYPFAANTNPQHTALYPSSSSSSLSWTSPLWCDGSRWRACATANAPTPLPASTGPCLKHYAASSASQVASQPLPHAAGRRPRVPPPRGGSGSPTPAARVKARWGMPVLRGHSLTVEIAQAYSLSQAPSPYATPPRIWTPRSIATHRVDLPYAIANQAPGYRALRRVRVDGVGGDLKKRTHALHAGCLTDSCEQRAASRADSTCAHACLSACACVRVHADIYIYIYCTASP